ncbi:MAG: DUF305 domain-containing protein [Pyrinomonadaceae bacterium]
MRKQISAAAFAKAVLFFAVAGSIFAVSVSAQKTDTNDSPVVVQPGAPGQDTKTLPSNTTGKLPPRSAKDVEFMQGMIMHHAQAVEMVALMDTRTDNKELRLLGARISHTQADEIGFMKRWLTTRGEKTEMPVMTKTDMKEMDHGDHKMDHGNSKMSSDHMMPGMLTKAQMEELAKAKGAKFDELFLKGMIQHHGGALIMVKDLFDTFGAGQDAELFNFATDVDSGQRAEIRVMENMLGENR